MSEWKPDPFIVNAVAEAWASIDGKLDLYDAERDMDVEHPDCTGTFEGYQEEAKEMINRLRSRGCNVYRQMAVRMPLPPPPQPSREG